MEYFKEEFVTEFLESNSIPNDVAEIAKEAYVAGFKKAESVISENFQKI